MIVDVFFWRESGQHPIFRFKKIANLEKSENSGMMESISPFVERGLGAYTQILSFYDVLPLAMSHVSHVHNLMLVIPILLVGY